MKIRKITLVLIFVLICSFALAGCGGNDAPADERKNDTEASQEEEPSADESRELSEEKEAAETEGILIAYFSHTGNTREAAQTIAEYTGGDLAEIKRAEE